MSKYNALWKYVSERDEDDFKLSYEEIEIIAAGTPIDHSFSFETSIRFPKKRDTAIEFEEYEYVDASLMNISHCLGCNYCC